MLVCSVTLVDKKENTCHVIIAQTMLIPSEGGNPGLSLCVIHTNTSSPDSDLRYTALTLYLWSPAEWRSPLRHLSPDPLLIVSVSEVARLHFDVQTFSSSQKRLTAGAERGRWAATGCCRPDVSLPLSSAPVQSALAAQAVAEHL